MCARTGDAAAIGKVSVTAVRCACVRSRGSIKLAVAQTQYGSELSPFAHPTAASKIASFSSTIEALQVVPSPGAQYSHCQKSRLTIAPDRQRVTNKTQSYFRSPLGCLLQFPS
ncbi:hypothetical protein EVAR_86529_1 [Eumeta japonica]|uniref:Uncharacterized protein n=1 Tax=Eumeta variegata TaxID=151549 RepID=A0A4C1VNX6_EUMVA|nr:hypothetical protein EVAR_86529_1 [Eumeta japonica]